jgi:SH3 domain protein
MIISRITKPSDAPLVFILTVSIFFSFCTIMFSTTAVAAESRYVKPSAEVVLRTGEGREYKVIGLVKDGDAVELLQEGDSYARVRLADGKEGWMLKRFLSVQPPLSTIVESLRAENKKLKEETSEALQKFEEVSKELSQLETNLNLTLNERDQIKSDYQNLQRDTADVIQIKEDMLKATKENELLVQEMSSIKEENNKLKKDESINWFLAGGGVVLVGMVIGRLSSSSRKRKSSLI